MSEKSDLMLSRRQLLASGGAALMTSLLWPCSSLATTMRSASERSLFLYNKHTGEWFKGPYWIQGKYVAESLKSLDHFLRDKLNNKKIAMDKRLLDLIYILQNKVQSKRPFEIICGYRSPETNSYLRRVSHGVAKNSLHLSGRAVDLRMSGINLRKLRDEAKALGAGGVGYYPGSGFIHIDVRPQPYYW